ncbi:hypothetical protein Hanom_Chr04g00311221 [Helianthus anomalus]
MFTLLQPPTHHSSLLVSPSEPELLAHHSSSRLGSLSVYTNPLAGLIGQSMRVVALLPPRPQIHPPILL